MKTLLIILVLVVALLFHQKAIVINLAPIKSDIKAIKKAGSWLAARYQKLKTKFKKQ